jgi:glycosyltransferase involved in cell wall biosynthesis
MSNRQYRVGVDCRLAGRRHAGIGRYTENLVRELLQLPNSFAWVFFFHDQLQANQVLEGIDLTKHDVEIIFCPVQHYSFTEQLQLPKIFSSAKLDLLHIPHFNVPVFYTGKIVVTIHDLLWHEYRGATVTTLPAWQYWPKYFMYRFTVQTAVSRAKEIIVPTQTVSQQVLKYYPSAKSKLHITYEGVEPRFFVQHDKKAQPVLLYVGSLYPHKNVKVVIDALTQLPEYTFKIVSARSAFEHTLRHYSTQKNLNNRVEFLGFQDDQKVAELLHTATALVQPSLSEGFGLTGLEALASGTPVIASNIPIFHEIYKDQAKFFEPKNSADFVEAVRRVEKLNRTKFSKAARQFAQQYDWSKMASQTLAVYNKAVQEK